jgi:hypothetical protein
MLKLSWINDSNSNTKLLLSYYPPYSKQKLNKSRIYIFLHLLSSTLHYLKETPKIDPPPSYSSPKLSSPHS